MKRPSFNNKSATCLVAIFKSLSGHSAMQVILCANYTSSVSKQRYQPTNQPTNQLPYEAQNTFQTKQCFVQNDRQTLSCSICPDTIIEKELILSRQTLGLASCVSFNRWAAARQICTRHASKETTLLKQYCSVNRLPDSHFSLLQIYRETKVKRSPATAATRPNKYNFPNNQLKSQLNNEHFISRRHLRTRLLGKKSK